MNLRQYEMEAMEIRNKLPNGPLVVVIGSGSFRNRDTYAICVSLGTQLAGIKSLIMLTGGVSGVGEAVGRSFYSTRIMADIDPRTYQILPRGSGAWDYGETIKGGETMEDRREILGRLSALYISLEGGPGTAHEAKVAQMNGATIIPVGRTGGFSREAYLRIKCPRQDIATQWQVIDDQKEEIERVSLALRQIIEVMIQTEEN